SIDKTLRWSVSHKMTHELGRYELRRRGMMGQDVEHCQPVFNSTACGDLVTEYGLLAVIVYARVKEERPGVSTTGFTHHRIHGSATAARLKDGPTGEAARHFLHVFLRVAAIDAESMQLHQLARVVFIDAASLSLLRLLLLLLRA